ncbi:hypothetical protein HYPSUDRAFT_911499 [Hypholoma sublateritium FD-334 SS-4]|uniref:FHA domain-containing protein n=1 Tax=Hypholoma sublateritium (strain FD-334 SS-4) TaxID=945553 RepID=A0A0D2NJ48_HYPSF|nr:hypothetical protein HYPSUDRAFT_911499 [Hypholoma sublateritium FD-334 SS-4]
MDDDIVFLGTSRPTIPLPKARPSVRPVTGITLHVEKNGDVAAHRLTFRRATTAVVHVGRRSASDAAGDDSSSGGDGAASFRCAVVSRRHAKVAFSDSGHAYLIDLGSHHGTHVRSPADRSARALVPETPTLLVDGDLITFGKPVGKGDESVRPIVARVELVYTPVLANATDGSITNSSSRPTTPSTAHVFSVSSSGRYGIPVGISAFSSSASSSSSDAEGESVDHDSFSDIEEIPPPPSHSTTQSQPQMQSQRESQPHIQSPTASQDQSSSWSVHPAPPIPYIFGKVANTLRFQPRNVPLRDSVYTPPWLSNRFQHESTTQDQQPQQPANAGDGEQDKQAGGIQLCDPPRISEDLFQRQERLRDALGRRRVQQVQEGIQPDVPSPSSASEPTVTGDAGTPSAPISTEASVNLGASSPAPTPVSSVVNRLPSMTSLIERPLNHFRFAQLSQFFLGGLGTEKTKMATNSEGDADVEMPNAVGTNPSLPAAAESQEPVPTGASETIQKNAVETSNPIKDLGAEAPGVDVHPSSSSGLSVDECAPAVPPTMPLRPLPHWTEDFRPTSVPMPNCRLPSIANALSPGPANVNVHVHGPAHNTWVPPPPWCSPPAPHALAAAGPYHLPPTHSPETTGTWYWNDSLWEACNFAGPVEGNAQSDGMRQQAHQACARILAPIATPANFSPVSAEKTSAPVEVWRNVDYYPTPATAVDAGDVDGVRGAAQSPPPAPRIPAPASPGLSYASSREASPVASKTEDRQLERERSEPMELASRSPSPALPQRVDKGKRRLIQFSFDLSDEDEDGDMDWDGDGDDSDDSDEDSMDFELAAELASYTEDKVKPGPGNMHLLTLMRDKVAAHEAEIAREQEREREKERERQKEWAEAVEEREELRREIEREERKDAEIRSVQWTVKKLEGDFNTFRALTNVKLADHTSQLTSFDGRIREVDAECGVLCVRVESLSERCEVAQIDAASVNATLDNILESGERQRVHKEGEDDAAMVDREAVKASVSDVRALIDGMLLSLSSFCSLLMTPLQR